MTLIHYKNDVNIENCFQNGGRPPSWIWENFHFWPRDLYLHLIHLHSEFHVNRPIRRRNIAKTIFNMASVRHLEFVKIAILVNCPISACDSSSPFRNLHKSENMAPIYSQKRFSIWHLSATLNLKNLDFMSNFHARNGNLYMCTKFDRNRIIPTEIWR